MSFMYGSVVLSKSIAYIYKLNSSPFHLQFFFMCICRLTKAAETGYYFLIDDLYSHNQSTIEQVAGYEAQKVTLSELYDLTAHNIEDMIVK